MGHARRVLEWDQTAALWALIANCNRDPAKKATPFGVWDIHPFKRDKSEFESDKDREPDYAEQARIKQSCKVTKINVNSLNRSRSRVSPPTG